MNLREETSATVNSLSSERDGAVTRYHELLASIRHVVKAREEHKDKAVGVLVKLRKIYDDERSVTVEAHVAERIDLRE